MRIALLHSRIRVEERLLAEEFAARGVDTELIDVRPLVFDIHEPGPWARFDVAVERCISQTQAVNVTRLLESYGVETVNRSAVIDVCGDKLSTSLALVRAGVPTPRVRVAVDSEGALGAVEQNGYPAVLKPTMGSWGRLLSRVNDRDAAEAIIEHKATLGSVHHSVFYVQEHIEKPGRDLRVFVVGDEAICGIVRTSEHWITNTARGGRASRLDVSGEVGRLAVRAAQAVGGGVLAIDLLETPGGDVLVSEVNHTMEFRNSIEPTGVNIPGRIVEFVIEAGRRGVERGRAPLVGAAVAP